MKSTQNENTSHYITEKLKRIKEELREQTITTENVTEVLKHLHPETASDTLLHSIEEISAGIDQIYQADTDRMNQSTEQILSGQMQGMSEEQQKGYLCQLFDSVKLSDEAMDSDIEKASVDSTDLAGMSIEELQQFVSEQLVNSIHNMAYGTFEGNAEEIISTENTSLKTKEDALLLAAAQYSESLEGNILHEYTKVPRVLGQCAAAQTKIVVYCDNITQSDLCEDEKRKKIFEFIDVMLALLAFLALSVLIGGTAVALATVTFEAVTALLGTGIIAFIAELILVCPIMLISIAAVTGTGIITYEAIKGVCALIKSSIPKIKQFYGKLVEMFGGENPYRETEDTDTETQDADTETEENGYEEDKNCTDDKDTEEEIYSFT